MKTERERQLEAAVGECYRILDEAIYPPGMRPPEYGYSDGDARRSVTGILTAEDLPGGVGEAAHRDQFTPPQQRDALEAWERLLNHEEDAADRDLIGRALADGFSSDVDSVLDALEQCVFDAWQEGFDAEHVSDRDFSEAVARASELKDQIFTNTAAPEPGPEKNDG